MRCIWIFINWIELKNEMRKVKKLFEILTNVDHFLNVEWKLEKWENVNFFDF